MNSTNIKDLENLTCLIRKFLTEKIVRWLNPSCQKRDIALQGNLPYGCKPLTRPWIQSNVGVWGGMRNGFHWHCPNGAQIWWYGARFFQCEKYRCLWQGFGHEIHHLYNAINRDVCEKAYCSDQNEPLKDTGMKVLWIQKPTETVMRSSFCKWEEIQKETRGILMLIMSTNGGQVVKIILKQVTRALLPENNWMLWLKLSTWPNFVMQNPDALVIYWWANTTKWNKQTFYPPPPPITLLRKKEISRC